VSDDTTAGQQPGSQQPGSQQPDSNGPVQSPRKVPIKIPKPDPDLRQFVEKRSKPEAPGSGA